MLANAAHSSTGASKPKYSSWNLKINTVQAAKKMKVGRTILTACHGIGYIFCHLQALNQTANRHFYFSHK